MERKLDRTTRILGNDPFSKGRAANQRNAQRRLNNANNVNNYVSSTVGNALQNTSDEVRSNMTIENNPDVPILLPYQVAQDNTRVNVVLPIR